MLHHHDDDQPEEDAHHPLALLVLARLSWVEEEESIEGQQTKRAAIEKTVNVGHHYFWPHLS